MKQAMKYKNGSADNAGSVTYQYCLSCGGALSKRFEYDAGTGSSPGGLLGGLSYEYDGLNLLRTDERYNPSGEAIDSNDPWRTIEVNTHRPGQIGALVGKRVYVHTDNDPTADETHDYSYLYDHIGNVFAVVHGNGADDGKEAYSFAQDAFGNEFPLSTLAGDDWSAAENDGIYEHQTGKRLDPFTGLYFFAARWYDSEVGRFVSRSRLRPDQEGPYIYAEGRPSISPDPTGRCIGCNQPHPGDGDSDSCPSDCGLREPEDWATCIRERVIDLIHQGRMHDGVEVEVCCRKLGGRADSDEKGTVSTHCVFCHCFLKICGMDFGFFQGEGKADYIDVGYENLATCTACRIEVIDLLWIIQRIEESIDNPPNYGPIAANPFRTNCQEWTESVLQDAGVGDCYDPWF